MRPKTQKTPTIFRQGDVLLLAVDSTLVTTKPVPREGGRIILAHGEATGHAHAIVDERAELMAAFMPGVTFTGQTVDADRRYLRLPCEGIALLHEEHGPIPPPAGLYEVRRQREYTPERIRTVAD